MHANKTTETLLFSILFLFFFQALSDFIGAIYAFGLLVTAFTVEIASLVLLFTSLLLGLFRRGPSRPVMLGFAYAAVLARLLEPMLNPSGKLLACAVSVGAFMLFFPALLHNRGSGQGRRAAGALLIAVSLSIFFRAAGSGVDLSETGAFQIVGWLLALLAVVLLWRADLGPGQDLGGRAAPGARITGLATGLAGVVLMISFGFASPAVIARWTGFSYPAVIAALAAGFILFGLLFRSGRLFQWISRGVVLAWNALFVLMVVLTILPHQIAFPVQAEFYALDAPAVSPPAGIFLMLMLLLSPVVFVDFMLFTRQIALEKPSMGQLGRAFAAAALFLLVMVFFHVFTTIYDYAPVIGPLFRDRFWLVYLLAGLGMALPLLLLRNEAFAVEPGSARDSFVPAMTAGLAALSLGAVFLNAPRPAMQPERDRFKVMTYNIQQGTDPLGNQNLDGQLLAIQRVDPDILGLQETDSARIANGNVDVVRYMADHLNMYSYYGPTSTTGTFGIALLSKYPIENPTTFFMYSEGEQTAAIQSEITVAGKAYNVFVTHLGNGGPMIQLQNMLRRVEGKPNVIAMGDFNFRPTTEQYALITRTLADSWLLKWPGGKDTAGISSDRRIDHIFVSPGTTVLESEYVADPASDHPYMYSVIEP